MVHRVDRAQLRLDFERRRLGSFRISGLDECRDVAGRRDGRSVEVPSVIDSARELRQLERDASEPLLATEPPVKVLPRDRLRRKPPYDVGGVRRSPVGDVTLDKDLGWKMSVWLRELHKTSWRQRWHENWRSICADDVRNVRCFAGQRHGPLGVDRGVLRRGDSSRRPRRTGERCGSCRELRGSRS
jgi:hypothetical protein